MLQVIGTNKTRTTRVLWLLEELGEPYDHINATPRSAEAMAANPSGKVPALRVGDDIITDSVAIMTYLADRFGRLTAPAGTIERAHQDAMMQFLVDEFDACLWTAARHSFILPEDMRLPAIKDSLRWEFARAQKELVRRMGDGPFVMGEDFTIVDIMAAHCGNWARNAKFEITEPTLNDYIDRMLDRPACKAARGV